MENAVILFVLIVLLWLGLRSTIGHFRREGGCCGGGTYRPKRKKLRGITERKVFAVQGMHCAHCQARVEEAVNTIANAAGKADWRKGRVTVFCAGEVADAEILAAIERAGYSSGS